MLVNEIFTSIDGEGIRAGRVCTFVRFTGCNLRCSWCDTKYSYDEGTEMSPREILSKIPDDCRLVTLTGGEPLLQDAGQMDELVDGLLKKGIEPNFETNGSVDFSRFLKDGIIITADCKLPSSGMSGRMDLKMLASLRGCDVLKFVIGSETDLEEAGRLIKQIRPVCHIFLSPVFGDMEPARMVEWLKGSDVKDKYDIRIQIQLHKAVWPPQNRGV